MKSRSYFLIFLLVAGIVSLIYWPSLHAPFYLDDMTSIMVNPNIRFTGLNIAEKARDIFTNNVIKTRPLAYVSFGFNYLLSGLNPASFRIVNIIIHVFTSFLVLLFVKSILDFQNVHVSSRTKQVVPIFSSVLFAVHPVATQSVTYIVQRMNSAMALFYIMAALFFTWGFMSQNRRRTILCYLGGLLALFLSAGFKEVMVTFPFIMMFVYTVLFKDYSDVKSLLNDRKIVIVIAFLVIAGAIAFFYFAWRFYPDYEKRDFTLIERVLTQLRVIPYYVSLFLLPYPGRLRLLYEYRVSRSLLDPPTTFFGLIFILICAVAVIVFMKRNKLISFSVFWFLFSLIPESSVIGLELVFEHRLYLPSVGLSLLAGYGLFMVFSGAGRLFFPAKGMRTIGENWKIPTALFLCIAVLFSTWTFRRNEVWAKPLIFWMDNIEKSSGEGRTYLGLSYYLMEIGKYEDAIKWLSKGLDKETNQQRMGYIQNNIGMSYLNLNMLDEAEEALNKGLSHLDGTGDRLAVNYAMFNLGLTHYRKGRRDEALEWFDKLEMRGYSSDELYYYQGKILSESGELSRALSKLGMVENINPGHEEALMLRAKINYELQRWTESLHAFNSLEYIGAKVIEPQLVFAAGYVYHVSGDLTKAEKYYKFYRDHISQDNPDVYYNLACVYSLRGEKEKALEFLEEALLKGFQNRVILEDDDLNKIRNTEKFRSLLKKFF